MTSFFLQLQKLLNAGYGRGGLGLIYIKLSGLLCIATRKSEKKKRVFSP